MCLAAGWIAFRQMFHLNHFIYRKWRPNGVRLNGRKITKTQEPLLFLFRSVCRAMSFHLVLVETYCERPKDLWIFVKVVASRENQWIPILFVWCAERSAAYLIYCFSVQTLCVVKRRMLACSLLYDYSLADNIALTTIIISHICSDAHGAVRRKDLSCVTADLVLLLLRLGIYANEWMPPQETPTNRKPFCVYLLESYYILSKWNSLRVWRAMHAVGSIVCSHYRYSVALNW